MNCLVLLTALIKECFLWNSSSCFRCLHSSIGFSLNMFERPVSYSFLSFWSFGWWNWSQRESSSCRAWIQNDCGMSFIVWLRLQSIEFFDRFLSERNLEIELFLNYFDHYLSAFYNYVLNDEAENGPDHPLASQRDFSVFSITLWLWSQKLFLRYVLPTESVNWAAFDILFFFQVFFTWGSYFSKVTKISQLL